MGTRGGHAFAGIATALTDRQSWLSTPSPDPVCEICQVWTRRVEKPKGKDQLEIDEKGRRNRGKCCEGDIAAINATEHPMGDFERGAT